jgi:protein-S-isoprenylcysteine O-methyltransferase Ste14
LNWQSEPALVAAMVLAWALDRKARLEERWLRERFPEYEDYMRRVRRFLPWIY